MTPWQISGILFGLAAYAIAWTWGGRPERLGAVLLFFAYMLSSLTDTWESALVEDSVRLLIFGWMCLRFDRWWLFVASGALILCGLVTVMEALNPALSLYAALSAQLGLWALVYLSLLAGAGERWLAGERPAADGAIWSRRRRISAS